MAFQYVSFGEKSVRFPATVAQNADRRLLAEKYGMLLTDRVREAQLAGHARNLPVAPNNHHIAQGELPGTAIVLVRSSDRAEVVQSPTTEEPQHLEALLRIRRYTPLDVEGLRIIEVNDTLRLATLRAGEDMPTDDEYALGIRRIALVRGVVSYESQADQPTIDIRPLVTDRDPAGFRS